MSVIFPGCLNMCIRELKRTRKSIGSFGYRSFSLRDRDGFVQKDSLLETSKSKNAIRVYVYDAWSSVCRFGFLRKKDLQGNVLSYRRRKTGHTLRVLLSPEALQLVRMVSNKDENSPYLFPILHSKEGTEAAYKEYQSALRRFNYQLSTLKHI